MNQCEACGKEVNRKELLFTEDRMGYCANPFTCNEKHPNSVGNIVARQGAVKMHTEEELETSIYENLNVSDEVKNRIMKIATKPQSIRLSKIDIAYYVLELQERKHLTSISEAVRYCIEKTMREEPLETMEEVEESTIIRMEPEPEPDQEPTMELEPIVKKGKAKVTVLPKAKDLIMAQIEEKDEKEEELIF